MTPYDWAVCGLLAAAAALLRSFAAAVRARYVESAHLKKERRRAPRRRSDSKVPQDNSPQN